MFNSSLPIHLRRAMDRLSRFETVESSKALGWRGLIVNRIRTSPGYNVSLLPRHVLGLHLGAAAAVLHAHEGQERLHHFQRGHVVFTPAGEPVHYVHAEMVDGLYLDLEPQWVEEVAESLGLTREQATLYDQLGRVDPVVERIGLELLREADSVALGTAGLGSRLYVESLTLQLTIHLLRHYTQPEPRDDGQRVAREVVLPLPASPRLQPAFDYIQAHLAEDLTLRELAATVHLSPFHFARVFKQATGLSPHQYLLRRRVQRAQQLLGNPAVTVAEAAQAVGFADHSHLTRHFKRLTGAPPRAR
jgi:AraC family transcriptional regulator